MIARVDVSVPGPPPVQQVDERELLKRENESQHCEEPQRRSQRRQRDRPEAPHRAGAVHPGRLVELVGDRLQAGQQDEGEERESLPPDHDDDRDERQIGCTQPQNVMVHARDERREPVQDPEVRVQHDRERQDDRYVWYRPGIARMARTNPRPGKLQFISMATASPSVIHTAVMANVNSNVVRTDDQKTGSCHIWRYWASPTNFVTPKLV